MNSNQRKPEWLKVKAFSGEKFQEVNSLLKSYGLNTVCQEANCPNRGECYNRGTATFLIMGPNCTRNCGFCDVISKAPVDLDPEEPKKVAEVAAGLKLKHVVVTSVTRDDLPDGGADQFAKVVCELRKKLPKATIEILTPDFKNKESALDILLVHPPDVFNHNVETVPRLYKRVRPAADYQVSLSLLNSVAKRNISKIKSGIMVGLGERVEELVQVFEDLVNNSVSLLTIGQYLSPSKNHLPVEKYYHPDEFLHLKELAEQAGIKKVASAPLVRSSYKADQL